VDRLTRKELKTDKFAEEVGATVRFLREHRRQVMTVAAVVLAGLLITAGAFAWRRHARLERQEALRQALQVYQALVAEDAPPFMLSFKTEEEKNKAVEKAFRDLMNRYPGSDEAVIAQYYLGIHFHYLGKEDEAEKLLKQAAASGRQPYASQAAYSLAELYAGQGKNEEAEKILRQLIEHPTVLVTKEQATITLAKVLARKDPQQARKLLEPLRERPGAVGRIALSVLAELPEKPASP